MSQYNELVDRYIATWNEADASQRRALIGQTYTEDVSYVDPMMQGSGHDGLDGLIQGVHAQFPGYRFRHVGQIDTHNDRVRFSWELAPEGGPALAKGTDFAVVADGRLQSVTGFLDYLAGAS